MRNLYVSNIKCMAGLKEGGLDVVLPVELDAVADPCVDEPEERLLDLAGDESRVRTCVRMCVRTRAQNKVRTYLRTDVRMRERTHARTCDSTHAHARPPGLLPFLRADRDLLPLLRVVEGLAPAEPTSVQYVHARGQGHPRRNLREYVSTCVERACVRTHVRTYVIRADTNACA